jgi:hypothetical protein
MAGILIANNEARAVVFDVPRWCEAALRMIGHERDLGVYYRGNCDKAVQITPIMSITGQKTLAEVQRYVEPPTTRDSPERDQKTARGGSDEAFGQENIGSV